MKRILTILTVMTAFMSIGQQSAQYSQYIRNQYMINPGATGVEDHVSLTLGGRAQWVGLNDAPKTSYLYFSSPVDKLKGAHMKRTFGKLKRGNKRVKHPTIQRANISHAFGGQLLADQYGPFRTLKLMGSYAVHLPINRDYSFSFGTNLGLSSRSFIAEKAQVLSVMTNTGVFDQTYNTYAGNQSAQYTMDLDAGLYFYSDELFFGVSASQLTGDLVKFGNRTTNFDPKVHFFFTGGYQFQLNSRFTMTPAFLVKYVSPAPVSVEASVQFAYNDRFWFGTSYRHKDAVIAMLGANISDKFRIGYSFDLSISKLIKHTSGGHELVLGLMIGKSKSFAKFN